MLGRLPIASLFWLSLALEGCATGGTLLTKASTPQKVSSPTSTGEDNTRVQKARRALSKGNYDKARRLLEDATQQSEKGAKHLHAELLLLLGEYETVALTKGSDTEMILLRTEALTRLGRLEEALATLSTDRKSLDQMRFDFVRGEIFLELGRKGDAKKLFLRALAFSESSEIKGLSDSQRMLTYTIAGRCAHRLREPEAANEYYNRAEQIGDATLELLLSRADLYLEKHDTSHALQIYEEAAEKWAHHPDVLLLEARIGLEAALAFSSAERLAKKVLSLNPRNSGALFILAGIEMRVMNLDAAVNYVERGLKINPRDLRLLSMKATKRFLAEDLNGFEEIVRRVLKLSPNYSTLFRIVGEYAEWEHRYPDIEKLMRRAARLDREDGRVRALLGLTLVRAGSDAAGIVELNRAYELDPFDVRIINTLNLYEKNIPELYDEYRRGPFKYRFPKGESELLKRYVPALLEQAHQEMSTRYGFTPRAPIGIEIYSSRDEFSVRTSGLPQVAIAGVCFGRKLATVSPIGAPGNLGMTLWHELAHVFHLELSKNRVPRFLTEGMAEWETARRDVGWSREQDLRLERALRARTLPPLYEMTRAFTHAKHMEDVATAYYASGLLAEWIVQSRGEEAAVEVLQELGKKRLAPQVIEEVLGAKSQILDREFRSYLNKKVSRFRNQFVSDQVRTPAEELAESAKRDPSNGTVQTRFGLALLAEGKRDQAEKVFQKVQAKGFHPQAQFALARIALSKQDKKGARSLLLKLVDRADGYEVRMALGRVALAEKDEVAAKQHLESAGRFDPMAAEPISILAALHKKSGNKKKELEAVRKWAQLSENDPKVHQRLIRLLMGEQRFVQASHAANLALWTDLAGSETHRLAGYAFSKAGDLKRAEFEWESALLVPNTQQSESLLEKTWTSELKRRGLHSKAASTLKRLRKRRSAGLKTPAETHSSGSK